MGLSTCERAWKIGLVVNDNSFNHEFQDLPTYYLIAILFVDRILTLQNVRNSFFASLLSEPHISQTYGPSLEILLDQSEAKEREREREREIYIYMYI